MQWGKGGDGGGVSVKSELETDAVLAGTSEKKNIGWAFSGSSHFRGKKRFRSREQGKDGEADDERGLQWQIFPGIPLLEQPGEQRVVGQSLR